MPYTQNPDMVALTIGRVVLDRISQGKSASIEDIVVELQDIVAQGHKGRVSEQMAEGALAAISDAEQLTTSTVAAPALRRLTVDKLATQ